MRDAAAAAGAALIATLNPHATKAAAVMLLAGTEQVGWRLLVAAGLPAVQSQCVPWLQPCAAETAV